MKRRDVLLVEPFYGGSHKQWADGFGLASKHNVHLLTMPSRHWKWRMHGAAVTLADRLVASELEPELILATDMLDVSTFMGLGQGISETPVLLYFHENQITYPWSNSDNSNADRDNHYGFINYTSALRADKVLFNSHYHRDSFLKALPDFLRQFPDFQNTHTIESIESKSEVVHLAIDLMGLDRLRPTAIKATNRATILWNHRWEYDKNPEEFFNALFEIQNRGWEFNLIVVGESYSNSPKIFDKAKELLHERIVHWGFVKSREDYVRLLWSSDILPVTSNQDFFGGSVVEAMYCNVKPLLPKRLAYPEHVPKHLHHAFFYEQGELVDRLQRLIKDVSVLRKQQTRSFVEHYDWKFIAPKMDKVIESLIDQQ